MNRLTTDTGHRSPEANPSPEAALAFAQISTPNAPAENPPLVAETGLATKRVSIQLGKRDTQLLIGIERAASELGWEITRSDVPESSEAVGTIISGSPGCSQESSKTPRLPTVIIASSRSNVRRPVADWTTTISPDLQQAGRMAAGHLLSLGFPHLAFFTSCRDHWAESVAQGFFQACAKAHASPRIIPAPDGNPSQRAEQLLSHIDALPLPCAILADHDRHAIEIIAAARHLGLSVPEDVAVLGIGNQDALQDRSVIPYSSVDLDLEQLGYLAAFQLNGIIEGSPASGARLVSPKGLVIRTSSSPTQLLFPGVHKAVDIVRTSYAGDLSVPSIARACGMSVRNLHRLYRSATGSTIGRDIVRLRIEAAQRMLLMESQALDPIAAAVGLGNSRNLCRLFRKHLGLTPGQWRSLHLRPSLTGAA